MVVSWFDSGGWRNNASLGQNLQLCIGWQHSRASTDILMHRLGDTCARAYYSTPYMGTGGRWNGANSPIDPWQHGNEGGAERGDRRILSPT
jgi:hypothetical protein